MKAFLTTVLLLIFNLSIGQNSVANYRIIDQTNKNGFQTQDNHSNDELNKSRIATTSKKTENNSKPIKVETYSEKEWKKITKQIKRNKKRLSYMKKDMYPAKKIDTVYLHPKKESLLSGW